MRLQLPYRTLWPEFRESSVESPGLCTCSPACLAHSTAPTSALALATPHNKPAPCRQTGAVPATVVTTAHRKGMPTKGRGNRGGAADCTQPIPLSLRTPALVTPHNKPAPCRHTGDAHATGITTTHLYPTAFIHSHGGRFTSSTILID